MTEPAGKEFLNREEWRKWLEKNHASQKGLWVIIYKKKSEHKGLRYPEAVEEAICYGWIDSKMQSIDTNRFRQRFTPRKKNSIWSQKNKKTAEEMIKEGKMAPVGLEAIREAKTNGKWANAYTSKTPPEVPKDLEEALKKNEPAWKHFKEFPNSAQFQYVYWVNSAKKDETRQKRINAVVEKACQKMKLS